MGEVVQLRVWTKLPIEPDVVLTGNVGQLDQVLLIGIGKDGEFIAASSVADIERCARLAQRFLHKAMKGDYTDGE